MPAVTGIVSSPPVRTPPLSRSTRSLPVTDVALETPVLIRQRTTTPGVATTTPPGAALAAGKVRWASVQLKVPGGCAHAVPLGVRSSLLPTVVAASAAGIGAKPMIATATIRYRRIGEMIPSGAAGRATAAGQADALPGRNGVRGHSR